MRLTRLFSEFFESEKAGGILLLICTIFSLLITNSDFQQQYLSIWNTELNHHSLSHWINDGLMAIFFLLIGLELEREIYDGELSDLKTAALPAIAALGGMVVPAAIYIILNHNLPSSSGAGIPMATDIAFAIGILSLVGKKVPVSLKIFLTALAVIDDLGAIMVIALFYSSSIVLSNLYIALGIFAVLLVLNRMKIHNLIPYLTGGVFMWYFMLNSGVHATITGVLLAFAIPFGDGKKSSPSYILQHFLHKPVAFLILPLFALANTALILEANWHVNLDTPGSLGIIAGLTLGKPLGILAFSFIAVKSGLCRLPEKAGWSHITGAGLLGGIGFTMSIFITLLAFDSPELINSSKIAILIASLLSAVAGFLWLKSASRT